MIVTLDVYLILELGRLSYPRGLSPSSPKIPECTEHSDSAAQFLASLANSDRRPLSFSLFLGQLILNCVKLNIYYGFFAAVSWINIGTDGDQPWV